MRHMVNGRIVEVMSDNGSISSEAIRKAAGIPADRPLVLQLPDGSNRMINPGEYFALAPNQRFRSIPSHERG